MAMCSVFGNFDLADSDTVLYEDNEKIGNVCPVCRERGSESLFSMLKNLAQSFRGWACHLDELANRGVSSPLTKNRDGNKKNVRK